MHHKILSIYNKFIQGKNQEFWLILGVILFSLILRLPAFNPPALWYDDLWVGLASKMRNLDDFLLVKAVSPPLFAILQFLAIHTIPDKEISVQIFPILFSILQIPLFYFLVKRTTGNRWLAALGIMILALASRDFLVYSVRAKHYTFDSLSTMILLLYYIEFFGKKIEFKYLIGFLVLSFTLFFGSFTSIIISGILIHILFFKILQDFWTKDKSRKFIVKAKQLVSVIVFDIVSVVTYFKLFRVNLDFDVYEYWKNYFINIHQPLSSIILETAAKLDFFIMFPFGHMWNFFGGRGAEPVFLIFIVVFLCFGMVYLYKNKYYEILLFLLLFYPVTALLSALKIYPLAGGRVDIYSYPLTILLAIFGLWQIMEVFKFGRPARSFVFIYLYFIILVLSVSYRIEYPYDIKIKNYVDIIEENITDQDVVLLAPFSDYSFAYYTKWPIFFQRYPTATGFIPIVDRANVFALPSTGIFNVDTRSLIKRMEYFIGEAPKFEKIYFFSSHCFDDDRKYKNYAYKEFIEKEILKNNFSLFFSSKEENTCFLKIYKKND